MLIVFKRKRKPCFSLLPSNNSFVNIRCYPLINNKGNVKKMLDFPLF